MNQDNPYSMNQTCKVCGEPAAGFHFGAFTCEGCKSFFGRSYNNLSSISECKNNGECVINKKNRTACKACRLRKCLLVGMSKSGSRYGRRSNWFKIHCLLQEQQQQAAAMASAVHHHHKNHNNHLHSHHSLHHQHHHQQSSGGGNSMNQKTPPPATPTSAVTSAAAAAASITANALSMLGHPGGYPSALYPPRTKEELMMLGLEEYKHSAAASPSVSSPESHNSDNSIDVNVRNNTLLRLGKHSGGGGSPLDVPAHLNKDLFLPLTFSGLGTMPVMPPPAFLPPSHLLFPGYHPALYQHHQGLLKQSSEQQQHQAAVAAVAVQHLFNNSPSPSNNSAINNKLPTTIAQSGATTATSSAILSNSAPKLSNICNNGADEARRDQNLSPRSRDSNNYTDGTNNKNIPNGNRAAEDLTKRFYLDAVLNSQRNLPPHQTLLTNSNSRHNSHKHRLQHDHSISALVTPNSESGGGPDCKRSMSSSCQDLEDDIEEIDAVGTANAAGVDDHSDNCGEEELVVSMTPPRSPNPMIIASPTTVIKVATVISQDNPIDLSMKTSISESSVSSKSSSASSMDDQRQLSGTESDGDETNATTTTIASKIHHKRRRCSESNNENSNFLTNNNNSNNNNNNNNNITNNNNNNTSGDNNNDKNITTIVSSCDQELIKKDIDFTKAAVENDLITNCITPSDNQLELHQNVKRLKIQITTTPLDLTTRV